MALYNVTFESAGGDSRIRKLSFDSDADVNRFANAYNAFNQDAKVIRINRLVSEMSEKDREAFKNKNFNGVNLESFKILYLTTDIINTAFIVTLPFLDKLSTGKADLTNIMQYIKDFKEIKKYGYNETF